jgi:prolipoprotein diacylglyceryltransferase
MIHALLSYIIWNPSPQIIPGLDIPRWYSLLFAGGFVISYFIMSHFFRKEGKPVSDVDRLTMYMVIGTVVGARLGHVLFYEPERYLSNPIDILKTWEGGLASHGAAISLPLVVWLYAKRTKGQNFLWVVDRVVIVVALTGCLIRLGNFMNSEIGGKPTGTETGVVFTKTTENVMERRLDAVENAKAQKGKSSNAQEPGIVPIAFVLDFKPGNYSEEQLRNYIESNVPAILSSDYASEDIRHSTGNKLEYELVQKGGAFSAIIHTQGIVRHPTQLYEASAYLAIFFLLFGIWNRNKEKLSDGFLFGVFMVVLWGSRFMLEYMKENQVAFEESMALNMGQILSIPLVLSGFALIIYAMRKKRGAETAA